MLGEGNLAREKKREDPGSKGMIQIIVPRV